MSEKLKIYRNFDCPGCNQLIHPSFFSEKYGPHSQLCDRKFIFKLSDDKREVMETFVLHSCEVQTCKKSFYVPIMESPQEYLERIRDILPIFIGQPWVLRYIEAEKNGISINDFMKKVEGDK